MDQTPNVDKMDDAELKDYAYMLGLNLEEPEKEVAKKRALLWEPIEEDPEAEEQEKEKQRIKEQKMKGALNDFKGLMLEMQQANPKAGSTQQAETADMDSSSIGENTISNRNGLPNEEGLHTMSGWEKPFKGRNMRHCIQKLNNFHRAMNVQVELSNVNAVKDAESAYQQLLNEVTKFVNGAQKGSSLFHGKEEAAMLPAMSSLLIKLYSMGNVFDKGEWIVYDYMMEHNLKSVRLGLALTGRSAQSVQGNMVSTGIEEGQIDRTALQMKKQQGKGNPDDFLSELNQRRLPALGDKIALEQLQRIAAMLEDIELQAEDDIGRHAIRVRFFDITKTIQLLISHPELLTKEGVDELNEQQWWNEYEKQDFANAYEYFQAAAGKTLAEAAAIIGKKREEKVETAGDGFIQAGGAMSTVLIDDKKVLRTAGTGAGNVEEQRKRSNFNYDEAYSRLSEVTGLGSIAKARTTYFEDSDGNLQYGTNMEKAAGKEAFQTKLSFGSEKADSQMKAGRHNVFSHETPEQLEKNAGLIISSFKMQILDYLAFHQDRHTENFFIDLDAQNMEQAFTGIDNDFAFGAGISRDEEARARAYSEHAEGSYDNKAYQDLAVTLTGFQCIPEEIAKVIEALNEESIGEAMKPYLDRASRFAVMRRVRQLKDYVASKSKVVNVRTKEGMEEFKQATLGLMLQTLMENHKSEMGALIGWRGGEARKAPSVLARTLLLQYFTSGMAVKKENNSNEYKYVLEQEYITDNTSMQDYFKANNKEEREKKWWNSLDGLMKEAHMSPEQVWDNYVQKEDGESEEDFAKRRKKFAEGKYALVYA